MMMLHEYENDSSDVTLNPKNTRSGDSGGFRDRWPVAKNLDLLVYDKFYRVFLNCLYFATPFFPK